MTDQKNGAAPTPADDSKKSTLPKWARVLWTIISYPFRLMFTFVFSAVKGLAISAFQVKRIIFFCTLWCLLLVSVIYNPLYLYFSGNWVGYSSLSMYLQSHSAGPLFWALALVVGLICLAVLYVTLQSLKILLLPVAAIPILVVYGLNTSFPDWGLLESATLHWVGMGVVACVLGTGTAVGALHRKVFKITATNRTDD